MTPFDLGVKALAYHLFDVHGVLGPKQKNKSKKQNQQPSRFMGKVDQYGKIDAVLVQNEKNDEKKYRKPKILAIKHQNRDQDFGFENFLNLVSNTVPTFVKLIKRIDDELSSILQAIEINHSQAVKLCNKIQVDCKNFTLQQSNLKTATMAK